MSILSYIRKHMSPKAKLTQAVLVDQWLCPVCDSQLNPPMVFTTSSYKIGSPDFGKATKVSLPRRCPHCE